MPSNLDDIGGIFRKWQLNFFSAELRMNKAVKSNESVFALKNPSGYDIKHTKRNLLFGKSLC